MNSCIQQIFTIVITLAASSGLWSLIMYKVQKHDKDTNDIENMSRSIPEIRQQLQNHTYDLSKLKDVLKGMGHTTIISHSKKYLKQGWIDPEDFDDLYRELYLPYKALGGNGTAKKIILEVAELPTTPGGAILNKQRLESELQLEDTDD